jgi:YVTN family beta-propeller protein
MKFTKFVGSFLENTIRLKAILSLFGLALLTIETVGAEPSANVSTESTGPKNTIVATIPCGSDPYDIVVSPDNNTVYVASRGDNTVVVINATTNTVTTTIPVGVQPTGIAITPDGTKVYVTNFSSSSVTAIDTATNLVTATFTLNEEGPTYLAVSPNGSYVYVATAGSLNEGAVSVINTTSNEVTSIPTSQNNIGIQVLFNPSGKEAYLSGYKGIKSQPAYLFEFNPAAAKLTKTINLRNDGYVTLAMNPNGKSLYLAEANHVDVFNIAENKVVKKIALPSSIVSVLKGAVTPNGKYLYLPSGFLEEVVMIDLATNKSVKSFQAGSDPTSIAIAPNGHYAYVADGSETASGVSVVDISDQ